MCSDFNWKGECITITVPLKYNSCTTLQPPWYLLPSLPPLYPILHAYPSALSPFPTLTNPRLFNLSSLTPVLGTVCWLNNSNNCSYICRSPSGCSKIVEFPGYANLSTYGYPGWTDRV